MTYDFSGYATKANLKCVDGRTILPNAFKAQDGMTVPLVWNHQHGSVDRVLGHALLENRKDGMYAYCSFNDTSAGKDAKEAVRHGDVTSMSILANQLQEEGDTVEHGVIREVSLVLAGANPGARIDTVIRHGEFCEDEAVIYTGDNLVLAHADDGDDGKDKDDEGGETVEDVVKSMSPKQRNVMYALIGEALKHSDDDAPEEGDDNKEEETMKHNLFDNDKDVMNGAITGTDDDGNDVTISHSIQMECLNDAKRNGSLRDACLQHGLPSVTYGVEHLDYLFPDYKNINNVPDFIQRDMGWVGDVMNAVHHVPFSRIKSMHADITADEARAKGYIKGKLKKEEVFTLLKRTTDPTTIYKKQKLDRDDVLDITSFDIVAWIKSEMRMMLDEEIARAVLVGDGRLGDSDDKIPEDHIRPVWTDHELYSVKQLMSVDKTTASGADAAEDFIDTVIRSRKEYKGSGNPVLFCSEDILTECLLLKDKIGHKLYKSVSDLATTMRVSKIVTVPVMEGLSRTATELESAKVWLMGIIVNLRDYSIGADKGGAVAMFEDFDIDYNQQKYLIETRASGALTKPKSAIVVEMRDTAAA